MIINPASAGGATGKRWPALKQEIDASGLSCEPKFTRDSGHAAELAKEAAQEGYEAIVAVGGDGTFHQVVNGLAQSQAMGQVALGLIPSGTGNDIARNLGIPRNTRKACQRLRDPRLRRIDIGVVVHGAGAEKRESFFLSAAGVGFDAAVVHSRERYLRGLRGRAPYVLCILLTLPGYRNREVGLTLDGAARWNKRVNLIVVSNGRYFAGGMKIAPAADLSDGWLDVVTVGNVGKFEFLRSLLRVYTGTHIGHPKVEVARAGEVEIHSQEPLLLQADGVLLGQNPCRIRVLPSALSVIA